MSNFSSNNSNNTKHIEIELKHNGSNENNDDSTESQEMGRKVFENKTEIIVKHKTDPCNKIDNVETSSLVLEDIIINIEDEEIPKKNMKSKWYTRLFKHGSKKHWNLEKSKKSRYRRKTKMCVLFSFGRCGFDDDDLDDYEILEDRGTYVMTVMIITGSMLLASFIIVGIIYNVPVLFEVFHKPSLLLHLVSIGGLLLVYFSMLCLNWGHRSPCCYILLCFTVIFASLIAAFLSCYYEAEAVMYGLLGATGMVVTCILLAISEFDFTSFWLYLIVISSGFAVVALSMGIGALISGFHLKPVHIGILATTLIMHSIAFVMELQMILGGKSIVISDTEYAMGAFMLYTSMLDIFLKILQIIDAAANQLYLEDEMANEYQDRQSCDKQCSASIVSDRSIPN